MLCRNSAPCEEFAITASSLVFRPSRCRLTSASMGRKQLVTYLVACCATLSICWTSEAHNSAVSSSSPKIIFDLDKGHPVEENLWGIFFEEVSPQCSVIRHAGSIDLTRPAHSALQLTHWRRHQCRLTAEAVRIADTACWRWWYIRRTDSGQAVRWLGLFARAVPHRCDRA